MESLKAKLLPKFMPRFVAVSKVDARGMLSNSLKRLGLGRVDLYQMHWPLPVPITTWMNAMAECGCGWPYPGCRCFRIFGSTDRNSSKCTRQT
jgi:hypothetical protein